MDEHLLDNELVKFYFKKKYPDNRYQFKTYSVICDMFYNPNKDILVDESDLWMNIPAINE